MKFAISAIVSTDAIASDATTQVEPHNSANWMIDFDSSSMKPAPSRKNCHDHRPPCPRVVHSTTTVDTTRISASAML